jgi:hypothetical protein
MAGVLARSKESLYGTMQRVRSRMKSRLVNGCFYGYLGAADEDCSDGSKWIKGWEWKWAQVGRKKDLVPWLGQQHTQQQ